MGRLLVVLIFCYSQFLFVVRSSDGLPCAPLAMCANLADVSFPFGAAPNCGASPSFLVSSCDTHQAYWDLEAIGNGSGTISAPPAVMGLSYSYSPGAVMAGINNGGYGFVNLTWNSNSLQTQGAPSNSCSLAHHDDESGFLPDAINLTAFASSALQFSLRKLVAFDVDPSDLNWTDSQVQFELQEHPRNVRLQRRRRPRQIRVLLPRQSVLHSTDCREHVDSGCTGRLCSTASKIGLGVAVSVVAMTILVGLALWCLLRRRSKSSSSTTRKRFNSQKSFGDNSSNHFDFNGLFERPTEFSYNSLASATASFSTILGIGGFGVVYKGTLKDSGHMIAVKVLEANCRHAGRQFLNEVATVGNIHHVNVVRLVGFCVEKSRKILVYEFVVNGSLDRWLFKGGGDQLQMGGKSIQVQLDWKQRFAIAVGIARGLCYLHEECRHRIVHCDIKPQNILLDEQMRPKIADFGLAKLMTRGESQVLTLAKGTPGYVAPEFWTGGESQLSTKFDVYSYGMVLLELMSGRRNFVDHCFPAVAFDAAMEGDFKSILDESVAKHMDPLTTMEWQQVRRAAFAALWCIQDHPARRPCMSEVVQYLEGVAAISEQPLRPAIACTATNPSLPSSNHNLTVHNPIALSGGR